MDKTKQRQFYSTLLTIAALILIVVGLFRFFDYNDPIILLLLFFAIATQSTMTQMVGGKTVITVSTAISFAAAGLYDPFVGAGVESIANVALWLLMVFNSKPKNWKLEVERFGVNTGAQSLAVLAGGVVLVSVQNILPLDYILGQTLPWLFGAIVTDQINFWLIAIIIFLANGVKPLQIWKDNRWAVPMNVLVISLGGGLLYVAVTQFGILGLAIFVLPLILSAYTYRLTVNNTKKQMEQLEEMVALRTKELEDANEELTALHEEKNAFLAVLTHDMRTPLTSIKGYSSILRDRELEREQQVKIAKVILNSQETLLDIVNNILDLEKMQSGNTPVLLEVTSFDLALVTKTAVESLQAPAHEKSIKLTYDDVPSPVMVQADLSKIQRVILNLISNAVKYTPEEGSVFVSTTLNGRYAYVEIKDTGYGIPEDELPHIFDRYSRVKGHQHLAIGTGLGLAIVKSLIDAHNGEILVASEVNVGSTFTIKLPTNY